MGQTQRHIGSRAWSRWRLLLDPQFLPVDTVGLTAKEGDVFVIAELPLVGTRFLGRFDCQLASVVPPQLLVVEHVAAVSQGRQTQWTARWSLNEDSRGTTICCQTTGFDLQQRNDRVLEHVYMVLVDRTFTKMSRRLNKQNAARTDHHSDPPSFRIV